VARDDRRAGKPLVAGLPAIDRMSGRPPAPFIVGASRSGTTLLRLMLDSHPALAIPNETQFLPGLQRALEHAADPSTVVLDAVVTHPRWPGFGLDPDALRERLLSAPDATLGDALRAFYSMYAAKHGKPRWGDKTPDYVLHMPTIAELLPEARFIHLIRDGRDVALSVIPMWFGPASLEEAAHWWVGLVTKGRHDASTVDCIEVRYEQLVSDPEEQLRRVCAVAGLDFRVEMLHYDLRTMDRLTEMAGDVRRAASVDPDARADQLARNRARLSEPPDTLRVGRWRTEMTADEQRRFTEIAGDLLEELGYPLE
jgi:Sulfotransferase family